MKTIRILVNAAAGGGSAGNGTLQHIATGMLMRAATIQVVRVPYKGSQQVLASMAADAAPAMSAEEFTAHQQGERERFGKYICETHIRVN